MEGDGYQRYSDPNRYWPLVDAAGRELVRLEREFDVVRSEGLEVDPALVRVPTPGRLVRLTPRIGGGAPVTMWLDDDPESRVLRYGLMVRFGRYHTRLMPDCGCDGCFQDGSNSVESLIEDLEFYLRAVTEGGFLERLEEHGRLYVKFSISTGQGRATQQFDQLPATDIEQPADGWAPWVRRGG